MSVDPKLGYDPVSFSPKRDEMMRKRLERPEAPAIYDSRNDDEAEPYTLTTRVDGKTIDFDKPMPDPFHHTTLVTRWPWWCFWKRTIKVEVHVGGRHDIIEAVSELDGNYRGEAGSARRLKSDLAFNQGLHNFADGLG